MLNSAAAVRFFFRARPPEPGTFYLYQGNYLYEGNYEGNHRLHASPQSLFGGFGTKFFRVYGILLVASVSRRGGKRD